MCAAGRAQAPDYIAYSVGFVDGSFNCSLFLSGSGRIVYMEIGSGGGWAVEAVTMNSWRSVRSEGF